MQPQPYPLLSASSVKSAILTISPNPAKLYVEVRYALIQSSTITVEISTLDSKVVYREKFVAEKGAKLIDLQSMASGTYIVSVTNR